MMVNKRRRYQPSKPSVRSLADAMRELLRLRIAVHAAWLPQRDPLRNPVQARSRAQARRGQGMTLLAAYDQACKALADVTSVKEALGIAA